MDSSRIDRWLTIFANVSVLVALIFLALEINQNTNAIRASAVQEATNVARTQILLYVQDPEINRLMMSDSASLSPEDKQRLFWLRRSFWLGMQGLYRQTRLGAFPSEEWTTWNRVICSAYVTRDSEDWSAQTSILADDFVEMIEGCSEEALDASPD